jgi:hypothetical protein
LPCSIIFVASPSSTDSNVLPAACCSAADTSGLMVADSGSGLQPITMLSQRGLFLIFIGLPETALGQRSALVCSTGGAQLACG